MTSSSDTVTIPPNSSVAFPVGSIVMVVNDYNGTNSISPGSGVTIRKAYDGSTGAVTLQEYAMASLLKVATDTWFVSGVGVS